MHDLLRWQILRPDRLISPVLRIIAFDDPGRFHSDKLWILQASSVPMRGLMRPGYGLFRVLHCHGDVRIVGYPFTPTPGRFVYWGAGKVISLSFPMNGRLYTESERWSC